MEGRTNTERLAEGLIVPIYRKGDKKECSNYRGITLLSKAMKMFQQIMKKRIIAIVENGLEGSQSGFRPGRSTQDHIFRIKHITQKSIQQKKKVFLAFVDMEKAFDRVPRNILWEILKERGVRGKTLRIIQNIYKDNVNAIIYDNMISETFSTQEGLRQGGSLSPVLFVIFMDEVIKKCTSRSKKLHVGHKNLQRVEISEGVFADDVVIMAKNEKDLQQNINTWNTVLEEYGMKINKDKTKVMMIGEEQEELNIDIEKTKIEQVKTFQYLGVTIDEKGKQDVEINSRIEKTLKMYYSMNKKFIDKKEISRETKMKVFKTIYRPILTFGYESWILTERQKSQIQAMEMKYLQRVRGVTKIDKKRNIDIREDLKIQSTLEFIEARQISWWGHLQRMEETRPVRRVWEAKTQKNKKRGRPRQTWDKVIAGILERRRRTWTDAKVYSEE